MLLLVEKGEFAAAKELTDKDEEAKEALIEMYNASGIDGRIVEDFEKVIKSSPKALFISPNDECLHYNLSWTYIGWGGWKSAKTRWRKD